MSDKHKKPKPIALDELVLWEAYPPPPWADLWAVPPPPPPPGRPEQHLFYDASIWPSPPFALSDLLNIACFVRSFEGRPATDTEQKLLYVCRGLLATAAKMAIYAEHFRKNRTVGVERATPLPTRTDRDNPRRAGAHFKRRQR